MRRLGIFVVGERAGGHVRQNLAAGGVSQEAPVIRQVSSGLGDGTGGRDRRPRLVVTIHTYGQVPKENVHHASSSGRRWIRRCPLGDVRAAGLADGLAPYAHDHADLGTVSSQSSISPRRKSTLLRSLSRGREGAQRVRTDRSADVHGYRSAYLPAVEKDRSRRSWFWRLASRHKSWRSHSDYRGVACADIFLFRATVRSVRGRLPCLLPRSGPSHPAAPGLPWAIPFLLGFAPLGGVAAGFQILVRALDGRHLESGGAGLCGTAFDEVRTHLPPPEGKRGFVVLVVVEGCPRSCHSRSGETLGVGKVLVLDGATSDVGVASGEERGGLWGVSEVEERRSETTGQGRWVCTGRAVLFAQQGGSVFGVRGERAVRSDTAQVGGSEERPRIATQPNPIIYDRIHVHPGGTVGRRDGRRKGASQGQARAVDLGSSLDRNRGRHGRTVREVPGTGTPRVSLVRPGQGEPRLLEARQVAPKALQASLVTSRLCTQFLREAVPAAKASASSGAGAGWAALEVRSLE